jgi:ssDNA-binding Zn-finger/Zn-ribbon topoisomerase 1
MVLNNKDFAAIDAAAAQYFSEKKIEQKCPRCGSEMIVKLNSNSYEVRCKKVGCISERFRGI